MQGVYRAYKRLKTNFHALMRRMPFAAGVATVILVVSACVAPLQTGELVASVLERAADSVRHLLTVPTVTPADVAETVSEIAKVERPAGQAWTWLVLKLTGVKTGMIELFNNVVESAQEGGALLVQQVYGYVRDQWHHVHTAVASILTAVPSALHSSLSAFFMFLNDIRVHGAKSAITSAAEKLAIAKLAEQNPQWRQGLTDEEAAQAIANAHTQMFVDGAVTVTLATAATAVVAFPLRALARMAIAIILSWRRNPRPGARG
jgi:hypothetical protein